ncbi:PHP domain-containing protein [Paenibacillus endoradicis]|uniref:PHP domain-containing protein n=1 Tax=Paenibacillus endoradicis TaxID=2972487 RepID=UPI002158E2A8|nr:PHP domain-containing protein [Paenibacillus endoradicis]MCR8656104.1 PHP domain-containing protein [Paenibacillus endoradicis]MCR8658430.1 PHP domain-containing protein [Paenibacillus endoradicis]
MAIIQTTIDMHVHTTASDGLFSPTEIVAMAAQLGLAAVAITDHDTTAGVKEALIAAEQFHIKLLPGIEISTVADGQEIHVLGYFTNNDDELWQQRLIQLGATRESRNEMLLAKLNELGIVITWQEVIEIAGDAHGSIGRPHFAQILINKGYVNNKQEAFDQYLGEHGKAYVQPLRIHPSDAYQWIKEAGGVAILAHPGIYHNDALVEQLLQAGVDGVEVNHSDHTPDQIEYYQSLAKRYNLLMTAGSDFHGIDEQGTQIHGQLGSVSTSMEVYDQIYLLHRSRMQ